MVECRERVTGREGSVRERQGLGRKCRVGKGGKSGVVAEVAAEVAAEVVAEVVAEVAAVAGSSKAAVVVAADEIDESVVAPAGADGHTVAAEL